MSEEPKNLRDLLLARHTAATPRLDALRRDALPPNAGTGDLRDLALLLFRRHRRLWTIVAATWAVLLLLQLTVARTSSSDNQPTPPREVVAAWFAQFNAHGNIFAQDNRRP